MTIWVLAADTTRARVFTTETRQGVLSECFDLVNPEARLHERDMTSDLSGRGQSSTTGRSSTYGGGDKHKRTAVERFARQVADRLTQEHSDGAFRKLYIVADPGFLGELRRALDDGTTAILSATVDKNLTRHSADEIRSVLPDYL